MPYIRLLDGQVSRGCRDSFMDEIVDALKRENKAEVVQAALIELPLARLILQCLLGWCNHIFL
jgi:hypothetical protein